MIRKLLSYLIPITIYKNKSSWSKSIEVTWTNGELVLDSENTNYSYGSLQRILRMGLKKIGFRQIKAMNKILVSFSDESCIIVMCRRYNPGPPSRPGCGGSAIGAP